MNNTFCIATISWARNAAEENVLKASLKELSKLGFPVFITDGGSASSFLEFIDNLPNFTLLQASAKGVYAQAKNSVMAAEASAAQYIIYTEPDKLEFFKNGLQKLIEKANDKNENGVILATRSGTALKSFPAFQQMTEATINNCCAELTGLTVDYTYGPFIFKKELAPHLNKITTDIGWGWRPYLFALSHRLGFGIEALTGDFMCPQEQRHDDLKERIYRMKQLEQNIRGLVLSTEVLL